MHKLHANPRLPGSYERKFAPNQHLEHMTPAFISLLCPYAKLVFYVVFIVTRVNSQKRQKRTNTIHTYRHIALLSGYFHQNVRRPCLVQNTLGTGIPNKRAHDKAIFRQLAMQRETETFFIGIHSTSKLISYHRSHTSGDSIW